MSQTEKKYILKGAFEGTFTTQQNQVLSGSANLPEGNEHLIRIHRGIITNATEISESEYTEYIGNLNYLSLTNIEILKSPSWPFEHDRIFSLKDSKLSDIELSGVETSEEKTFGSIKASIYSYVDPKDFKDLLLPDQETTDEDEQEQRKNQWNDNNWFDGKGCFSSLPNGCITNLNGCNPPGCNSPSGCFRWLLYFLLALLLLWLISQCTKVGKHLHCYYDKWQAEREIAKKEEENQRYLDKIEKTKHEIRPCQQIKEPKGTNEPKTYTFDLGQQNGTVRLTYDMYQIPDRVEVIYDGKLVAVTNDQKFNILELDGKKYNLDYLVPMGFAQGKGELTYFYHYQKNKPTELLIRVIPSQEFDMTEWTIDIFCP